MKLNYIKIILILLFYIIFFVVASIHTDKLIIRDHENYYKREYHGIIKDIEYIDGNRGNPSILINDQWIHLGIYEGKVKNYIEIGDSIVKKDSSYIILVYRRNYENVWNERKFN